MFGGFIAGIALPRVVGFSALLNARAFQMTRCFLLPAFFAYSGLNTDLSTSFMPTTLVVFVVLLTVAFGSKALASVGILRASAGPGASPWR